jgi:hypothetical protein
LIRAELIFSPEAAIKYFDSLRKNYPIRREFNNYSVKSNNLSEEDKNTLEKLRFKLTP